MLGDDDDSPYHQLMDALSSEDAFPATVRALCAQLKPAQLSKANESDRAPLMEAVDCGGMASNFVAILVGAGADPNVQDADGQTALHMAAARGAKDVVQALVRGEARLSLQDTRGQTPLHRAVESEAGAGVVSLLAGSSEVINMKDQKGETALFKACSRGDVDAVKVLVARRADVCATDAEGRCVLHVAAAGGHVDVLEGLVGKAHGSGRVTTSSSSASLSSSSSSTMLSSSAVSFPVSQGAITITAVKALLDAQDREGNTPLIYAAKGGHAPTVRFLLERGANESVRNRKGEGYQDVAASAPQAWLKQTGLLRPGVRTGSTVPSTRPMPVTIQPRRTLPSVAAASFAQPSASVAATTPSHPQPPVSSAATTTTAAASAPNAAPAAAVGVTAGALIDGKRKGRVKGTLATLAFTLDQHIGSMGQEELVEVEAGLRGMLDTVEKRKAALTKESQEELVEVEAGLRRMLDTVEKRKAVISKESQKKRSKHAAEAQA